MRLKSERGQVVLEYVLLLFVAVSMAALIMSQLTSRNEDNPGVLVKKWHDIQKEIGEDIPE